MYACARACAREYVCDVSSCIRQASARARTRTHARAHAHTRTGTHAPIQRTRSGRAESMSRPTRTCAAASTTLPRPARRTPPPRADCNHLPACQCACLSVCMFVNAPCLVRFLLSFCRSLYHAEPFSFSSLHRSLPLCSRTQARTVTRYPPAWRAPQAAINPGIQSRRVARHPAGSRSAAPQSRGHAFAHAHRRIRTYTYNTHAHTHAHTHTRAYTHQYTHTTHRHIYTSIHALTCTQAHARMHTHTRTHTLHAKLSVENASGGVQ